MRRSLRSLRVLAAVAAVLGLLATGRLASSGIGGDTCGDGVEEGNESCDDSNTVGGDGCSANCIDEICGDGILEPVTEECDDTNTTAGDGCAVDCTCEAEVCGDGIKGCTEECDDANTVLCDGCGLGCVVDVCEPPGKAQQACINAINKSLAGVIKTQNADNATCIKDVSNGKQTNTDACLGDDLKGKVGKAQGKTTTTDGKKCQPPKGETPGIAYTAPATVNAAGRDEPLAAATAVLGAAPNVIPKADKAGAKCQAEILKQLGAVSNKWAAEANKAKKKLLKGGKGNPPNPPPADSEAVLATGIDAEVAASAALDKAEAKATSAITGKCDDTQANAAADCGGATTAAQVAACVIAAAEEGACNGLELADGLDLDCPTVPVIP